MSSRESILGMIEDLRSARTTLHRASRAVSDAECSVIRAKADWTAAREHEQDLQRRLLGVILEEVDRPTQSGPGGGGCAGVDTKTLDSGGMDT